MGYYVEKTMSWQEPLYKSIQDDHSKARTAGGFCEFRIAVLYSVA